MVITVATVEMVEMAEMAEMAANRQPQNVTVDEALRRDAKRLSLCSSTPRLDAEVLLAHVLGATRASLLARSHEHLSEEALAHFEASVERRAKGEPVAY